MPDVLTLDYIEMSKPKPCGSINIYLLTVFCLWTVILCLYNLYTYERIAVNLYTYERISVNKQRKVNKILRGAKICSKKKLLPCVRGEHLAFGNGSVSCFAQHQLKKVWFLNGVLPCPGFAASQRCHRHLRSAGFLWSGGCCHSSEAVRVPLLQLVLSTAWREEVNLPVLRETSSWSNHPSVNCFRRKLIMWQV